MSAEQSAYEEAEWGVAQTCLAVRWIDQGGEDGPFLCYREKGHEGPHRNLRFEWEQRRPPTASPGEVEGLFAALTAAGWHVIVGTVKTTGKWRVALYKTELLEMFHNVFDGDSLVGALRTATEWAKEQETP